MFKKYLSTTALLSLLIAITSIPVLAQQPQYGPPKQTGWQVNVGIGSIVSPEYMGAKDYRVMVIPYIDVRYGENLFLNVPKGLGGYYYSKQSRDFSLKLGAGVAPNFMNRDEEDFPGLPEIGMAVEARGYAEMRVGSILLDLTLAQDLGTGHDGAYADMGISYGKRLGSGFLKVGGSLRFASKDYMRSFYTVNAQNSLDTGLDRFRASSGLESFSLNALYAYRINEKWRATVVGSANFLAGDAKNSSLVEQSTSMTVISAITYRF